MASDKDSILPAPEEEDENIGKITSDFFANTSAHGLPRVILSKSTFR